MNRESERQRLVELILKQTCNHNACENSIDCLHCKFISLCDEEAEDLANALLDNGVIVPPCKVGDVVWIIGNMKLYTKEVICSRKIISIQKLRTGETLMHFKDGCFPSDAIGVFAFYTREEALAKLGGKEDA